MDEEARSTIAGHCDDVENNGIEGSIDASGCGRLGLVFFQTTYQRHINGEEL